MTMGLAADPATSSPQARRPRTWRLATWLDRLVREPVVVLALALAAGILVFVMATPRVLPVLGGLATTVVLGVAGPWLALVGLHGRLTFALERCRVGEPVASTVNMTWFGRPNNHQPHVTWPNATFATAGEKVIPFKRGRYPGKNAQPAISSDWPFGIMTARRPLSVTRPLLVRPLTTAVRFPVCLVTARGPGRDASSGVSGSLGDVVGLREYRVGDTVRSIHWRQTARQGNVVVCERPGVAAPRVRIVLQGSEMDGAVSEPRLDAAVSIASSMVEAWALRGALIEVRWTAANGRTECLRPSDRRTLDEALDALACIGIDGPETMPVRTAAPRSAHSAKAFFSGPHEVDLEVVIAIVALAASSRHERHSSAPPIAITFKTATGIDTFRVPESPAAAAALDQALAEIGHDPDATRH